MPGGAWVHRLVVGFLALGVGGLLPAHRYAHAIHAHEGAPHADPVAAGEHDHDHEADPHEQAPAVPTHDDLGHDCPICHAVRMLYAPVAVALLAPALENVTTLRPPSAEQVVSVDVPLAHRSRAPPAV